MSRAEPRENIVPKGGLRVVRPEEVLGKLGLSTTKLNLMIEKGLFPKPFVIVPGGRAVGWLEGDVDMWIMARAHGGEVITDG